MADEEPKHAVLGGDLQHAITQFNKDELTKTVTEKKSQLPDAATIAAEKKAAEEEAAAAQ